MTNPKHTSSDLVERLRGDWPEILVEKHWMMDSDAIDKQREEAADRIEALEAENERLREALEQFLSLIEYQYCGSREAMNALQEADNSARAALGGKQ